MTEELGHNPQLLEQGFRLILEGLGLDLEHPHLKDTPARAARAWYNELCSGITQPKPKITTFPSEGDEMIVLQNIPIRSLCSHHLLPFYGHAAIAYIPGGEEILGLSKLSRIADYWARRPQVQEALTVQIADHVASLASVQGTTRHVEGEGSVYTHEEKGGVGVVIRAQHMCMLMRGVQHEGEMKTSAMRGVFLTSPSARAEFLQLIAT